MLNGIYEAENNDSYLDRYRIRIQVRETERSYVLQLIEFDSRYGAGQIESLFATSKRVVLRKNKSGHAMRVWSDEDFTLYPYQAGVPFYFTKIKKEVAQL